EPLFAGQVFVKIGDEERIHVRMTAGVRNFLYADGKPSIMKEKEINSIRKFSESYYNIKLFRQSMDQKNGFEIDLPDSSVDLYNGFGKIKVPKLLVDSLGYILFADSKYIKLPASIDKTK
ncbi:MAG: transcription termination/antitermination protein NusG, partial [Methanococcaceae archaeon]